MVQSDIPSPESPNPYQPPTDVAGEVLSEVRTYELPPLHWPRTIVMFVVLFVSGLATYGTALPFAFAILFGGLRTALIYRGCSKAMRAPPDYLGSTIVSPILVFLFQIAAWVAFCFICASLNSPTLSDQSTLSISAILAIALFALLYMLSIRVAVANCRPITNE